MSAQDLEFRPRAWRLPLAMFLLCSAAFLGVYAFAVLTQEGQAVENYALGGSTYEESGTLLSLVSTPNLAIATVGLAGLAMLFRGVRAAARIVVMIAAANVLSQLLKYAILDRPDLVETSSVNTFPSGHTVVFASVLFGLLMALPSVLRPLAAVASAAVLGTVAFQLLAYGWHRPSDVAGGILLVTAVVALAHLVLPDRARDSGLLVRMAQGPLARGLTPSNGRRGGALRTAPRGGHSLFDRHVGRGLLLACLVVAVVAGVFGLLVAVDGTLSSTGNLLIASQLLCITVAGAAVFVTLKLQRAPRI